MVRASITRGEMTPSINVKKQHLTSATKSLQFKMGDSVTVELMLKMSIKRKSPTHVNR